MQSMLWLLVMLVFFAGIAPATTRVKVNGGLIWIPVVTLAFCAAQAATALIFYPWTILHFLIMYFAPIALLIVGFMVLLLFSVSKIISGTPTQLIATTIAATLIGIGMNNIEAMMTSTVYKKEQSADARRELKRMVSGTQPGDVSGERCVQLVAAVERHFDGAADEKEKLTQMHLVLHGFKGVLEQIAKAKALGIDTAQYEAKLDSIESEIKSGTIEQAQCNELDAMRLQLITARQQSSGLARSTPEPSARMPGAAEDLAKYVGTYHGTIEEGDTAHSVNQVTTTLERTIDGRLYGEYRIQESSGAPLAGALVQRGKLHDRTMKFGWSDSFGHGSLVATFNSDCSGFDGKWDSDRELALNGRRVNRPWNGHR